MSRHPHPDARAAERAYRREHPVTYPLGRNLAGDVAPLTPEAAAWLAAHHDPAFKPKKKRRAPLKPKRLTDAQRGKFEREAAALAARNKSEQE